MAAVCTTISSPMSGWSTTFDFTAVNGTAQVKIADNTHQYLVINKLAIVADPTAGPSLWDGSGTDGIGQIIGSMKVSSVGSSVNIVLDLHSHPIKLSKGQNLCVSAAADGGVWIYAEGETGLTSE